jgi:hypothetical protein
MAEGEEKVASMFDQPWEDTIIMAVRDLQWKKALERFTLGQESKLPAPLLKLDGNTETALGDVVTSADDRFFLFEFKGDDSNMGSEWTKPLVAFMKDVNADTEHIVPKRTFIGLSKRAHHFVFPLYKPVVTRKKGNIPVVAAEVGTACYYDAAVAMTGSTYTLRSRAGINALMYGVFKTHDTEERFSFGLRPERMAVYLKLLTQAHKERGATKNIPMKAVLLSDKGFIWPCANMEALEDILSLLEVESAIQVSAEILYKGTKDILEVATRPAPPSISPAP